MHISNVDVEVRNKPPNLSNKIVVLAAHRLNYFCHTLYDSIFPQHTTLMLGQHTQHNISPMPPTVERKRREKILY